MVLLIIGKKIFNFNLTPFLELVYFLTLSTTCSYQIVSTYEVEQLKDQMNQELLINHHLIKSKILKIRIFLNPNILTNSFVFDQVIKIRF